MFTILRYPNVGTGRPPPKWLQSVRICVLAYLRICVFNPRVLETRIGFGFVVGGCCGGDDGFGRVHDCGEEVGCA